MADVLQFPKKAVGTAAGLVTEPLRHWPAHSVDDFGRDPHLVEALTPFARLRWDVGVGGAQHLPARGGALLVCNSRRWSLSAVYAAMALGETTGRPVRFVGRPDVAPLGPFMRRIGALLARPDEVLGALRHHELVLVSCEPSNHARHAGTVDHSLVGAAVMAGVPVFPVATMSSTVGRSARVEVGPQVRPRRKRKGPLAEVELAEQVQHHLQRMLDGFGGMQTGVAPLDWLAEG
ncbi:MAG: hypothetical protein ACOYMR_05670 [Ilumatobacteraceae bacterium]|jgi:1-acyl-sn-glycerol-3-phosphate acyltransferase